MESDDAAVVDDAVDDGGGHVAVAEHVAPSAELEVRGEDDASPFVAVGDDLEQEPGAVDVDGQVAEFVDDEQVGLADGLEFLVEPVLGFGLAQPHDQAGGGEEPDRYAPPAGEGADGDGEVGLAASHVPVEHEVLGSVDELEGRELFASPVGGKRGHAPVVAVEFLGLGEPGLSEQPVPFGFCLLSSCGSPLWRVVSVRKSGGN